MDIYVKHIDKNDKNTLRTIYEAIDETYFGEVKIFTKAFPDNRKNTQTSHKIFHLKSRRRLKPSSQKKVYMRR